jgi:hypothetical protein
VNAIAQQRRPWQLPRVCNHVDCRQSLCARLIQNVGATKAIPYLEFLDMARPPARGGGNRNSTKTSSHRKQQPEAKIGPFANGVGVSVWLNRIETDRGTRYARSITIHPRRYFDRDAQQWKDAGSYNQADIPALLFALSKAQEYCFETPLPKQAQAGQSANGAPPDEEIPF